MADTTKGAVSTAGLPPHIRALVDEIRPTWEATGATRERESILAYLRLSGWLQVQRAADQIESGLHVDYSEGIVYESRVGAATARAEAAEQRAEAYRAFAAAVVRGVYPGDTGAVLANHIDTDLLPDALTRLHERLAEQGVEAQPAEVTDG